MGNSNEASANDAAKRHRRAMAIYAGVTVLFAASVGYLAVNGFERSLDMTGGADVLTGVVDPKAPGFEAAVKATPVDLIAITDESSALASVILLARPPGDVASTVLVLPLEAISERDGAAPIALAGSFEAGGIDTLRSDVENVVGFAATDAHVLTATGLASALPATTRVFNPDTIYRATGENGREIVYTAGPIDLPAAEAARFMSVRSEGESPYNRFNRSLVFWDAVGASTTAPSTTAISVVSTLPTGSSGGNASTGSTAQVSATGAVGGSAASASGTPSGSDGSRTTQFGDESAAIEALQDALSGPLSAEPVGLIEIEIPVSDGNPISVYRVDIPATNELLPTAIPFPQSAFPGQRVGVKLLNGTTTEGTELRFAAAAVSAGGEIKVIGNGNRMDEATSSVVFLDEASAATAEAIADALGVEATLGTVSGADIGVVVTVGEDQL